MTKEKYPSDQHLYITEEVNKDQSKTYTLIMIGYGGAEMELMQSSFLHIVFNYILLCKLQNDLPDDCKDFHLASAQEAAMEFLKDDEQISFIMDEVESLSLYYDVQPNGGNYVQ